MMMQTLLYFHSLFRWLVLLFLIFNIYQGIKGVIKKNKFSKFDNFLRHWTATIAHIQLLIGILLYTQSGTVKYFWKNFKASLSNIDTTFFGLIHLFLMLIAIVFITIGAAKSKRQSIDQDKYKTMLIWYTIGLIIIFIAIPWPFSPLVNRPLIR